MGCMPLTCPHSGCQLGFWVFALMFCTRGFVYLRNLNLLTGITTNLFSARECLVLYTQILISGSYLILVKCLIWFNQDFLTLTITKVLNYDQKWKGGQRFYRYRHQKKICWKRFFFQFIPTVIRNFNIAVLLQKNVRTEKIFSIISGWRKF